MISDITDAISLKISELFPNKEITLEKIEQGFQPGSFAIQQGQMLETQLLDNRYQHDYSFTVLYWPESEVEPLAEINTVQYKLVDGLEYLTVSDLILCGQNRSARIVDAVLSVNVDYSCHVWKSKETADYQLELTQNPRVKE